MWIEQPPLLYRLLFPEAIWRLKRRKRKVAYITFDDGPIPEVTPWVLDTLDRYGVKATFFFVGDNVRRYPELCAEVKRRGHSFGNHTMHHLQGIKTPRFRYMRDITEADTLIDSPLFRPPHGLLRWAQAKAIRKHYNIVMYDLVTRDYSRKMTPDRVFANVRRYARNGSIIVFHDSLKAERNMKEVLPRAIEWLLNEGYELHPIPM
ncbi:MAG: polysaccharide deacetylase family protein [Bacteroidales bacterium]|nr:polysaccharide deacetylase family protein [Bacteroidales bacterium]MBD5229286.1 polysaccharide deacetylase family protein [Bacteroidales bacterium]MBD5235464.1 polysaccharide deacetylase family protein [Barnesiella sp.]MBD5246812.1 polysaccharide deacetylase family protein [Barnesiella sp.]MBD5258074.1 polysaccharide deacetylase family protein [Barnesiella sp.]